MKPRLGVFVALPLALVIIAACRADSADQLTLDEYFEQLDTALSQSDVNTTRRTLEFADGLDEAETKDEVRDILRGFAIDITALRGQFFEDLQSIDAPAAAQDAHADFVAVENDALDKLIEVNELTQFAESTDDFDEAQTALDEALAEILLSEFEACGALQEVADDNGVDIDLLCTG